jgi:predicted HTH transcriptional regulator
MSFEFDPVKYGVLWQKVESYEKEFKEIAKKQDKMEEQLEELIALANKSRGGFWMGMAIVSAVSGFISFIAGLWHGK